ncbi:MAG: amidohydrolase family protein [Mycobacteriales bacterium]
MSAPTGTPPRGATELTGGRLADLARTSLHDRAGSGRTVRHDVVDASVQVRPREQADLRAYLPRVWGDRRLPSGERYYYPNVLGDYLREAYDGDGPPGSDPELLERHLFVDSPVTMAVLNPLTLGLLPDIDLLTAICSATNEWLASTWLDRPGADQRYRGSIRVAPGDAEAAVREIERWADDPRFVQVSVPLQSLQPYGKRSFWPIWRAAAERGLPVMIRADAETGVEFAPSASGYFRTFLGFASYQPLTLVNHLASLMVEGVFDDLPEFRVVFGDGGWDFAATMMWRMDKDYRPMRPDMPWMSRLPSEYLLDNVRFVSRLNEGPTDDALVDEWAVMSDAERVLLYGSGYPAWDFLPVDGLLPSADEHLRRRVLLENAHDLYRGLPTGGDR